MPDTDESAAALQPGTQVKLMLLRVQLYTAMQQLTGQDLDDFWSLVDELHQLGQEMRL